MADYRETIMGHLKTALEQITVANGYSHTQQIVDRQKRHPSEVNEWPAILIGDPDVEHEQVGNNFDRVWIRVLVVGIVKADDPETEINQFARDQEKAVKTDSNAPHKQMSNVACPEINYTNNWSEGGEGICQTEFEWYYLEEVDA